MRQKTIYESFIRYHLLYGLVAWGGAKKTSNLTIGKNTIKIMEKIWWMMTAYITQVGKQ